MTYGTLLWRYLAPQRGGVLLMALLLLASIALQLLGPQVARRFIDAARAGAAQSVLVWWALGFIGVAGAAQAMRVLAAYASERVGWTATNRLRVDLARHLLGLDMGFHKGHTPGELIERVDGDTEALAGFFSRMVVQLGGSALLLVGVVVAMWTIDARLGAAFAVFAVLGLASLLWIRRFGTEHWRAEREQVAMFYGYAGEVLHAAEDVRSSAAVPWVLRRMGEHLRPWFAVAMRAAWWNGAIWMAAAAVFAAGDVLAYGVGGALFGRGAISLGAVYLVVAYTAMLAAPIEIIRTEMQDFQRAAAAIARVREVWGWRSALQDGTASVPHGNAAAAVSVAFENVDFAYRDAPTGGTDGDAHTPVLHDLHFRLAPGRVLGVLGRTGSGKTTLARLLVRFYDPDRGTVRLDGADVATLRLHDLRERVGMVTQDVQLLGATLRDNLTFFDPAVDDARLLALLDELGLRAWVEGLPDGLDTAISHGSLSAGEAQLVALGRVFIKQPGLVILDEASSRLDPATEQTLDRALSRLLQNRTAIIIAHRLRTVERADDILLLEDGRVLEWGIRAQLAADPASHFARLRREGLQEVLA